MRCWPSDDWGQAALEASAVKVVMPIREGELSPVFDTVDWR